MVIGVLPNCCSSSLAIRWQHLDVEKSAPGAFTGPFHSRSPKGISRGFWVWADIRNSKQDALCLVGSLEGRVLQDYSTELGAGCGGTGTYYSVSVGPKLHLLILFVTAGDSSCLPGGHLWSWEGWVVLGHSDGCQTKDDRGSQGFPMLYREMESFLAQTGDGNKHPGLALALHFTFCTEISSLASSCGCT